MLELVSEFPEIVRPDSLGYRARVYGDREEDGSWGGYIVFVPIGGGRVISTGRETTQSTFEALEHWAGTLSWVYLDGALERALERQPEVQLSRRLSEVEHVEAAATAEAAALTRAAELARRDAEAARREREIAEQRLAGAVIEGAEAAAEMHEAAAQEARSQAKTLKRAGVANKRRRSTASTRRTR
jgi:hypothetical protein